MLDILETLNGVWYFILNLQFFSIWMHQIMETSIKKGTMLFIKEHYILTSHHILNVLVGSGPEGWRNQVAPEAEPLQPLHILNNYAKNPHKLTTKNTEYDHKQSFSVEPLRCLGTFRCSANPFVLVTNEEWVAGHSVFF